MIDFDHNLFSIDIPSSAPAQGKILVSEPFLKEIYFHHSVIALIDYDSDAECLGVVLNRLTQHTLQSAIEGFKAKNPIPLYCGGPMSTDRLFYLHTLGQIIPDAKQVCDGLFFGGDFNAVKNYINSDYPTDGYIRFFLGYSGWSPRQIDEEIYNKVWAVTHPDNPASLLTGNEDQYWHRYVRLLGEKFKGWRYHPRNPHSN